MGRAFFWVATLYALWLWGVAGTWIFAPDLVLTAWGMAPDEANRSLGLRIAALVLGWGVILFLSRREPPSRARRAIADGSAVGNVVAAAGGIFSLANGAVGNGVLIAVAAELLAAAVFVAAERLPGRRIMTVELTAP